MDYTLAFSIFGLLSTSSIVVGQVPCELKWVPDGYGNYPQASAVESGSGDFVARVSHDGTWIPGRMSPSKGQAYITLNGDVFIQDTYEVLTNPENCVTGWVSGYGGSIPAHAVSVDPVSQPDVFIGRGVLGGMTIGGKVVPDESTIFLAYEDKEESRRNYEVLTSTYALLQGSLTNFKFDLSNLANFQNRSELINQEEIWVKLTGSAGSGAAQHRIVHSKNVEETFTLSSDVHDWTGIDRLSFNFPLWYGSSDVSGDFEVGKEAELSVSVRRAREISVERTINVANGQHFQACSIVSVFDNPLLEIPFESVGLFRGEGMTSAQVSKAVQGLQFTVLGVKGGHVLVTARGVLTGRFAIHASTYLMLFNYKGICSEVIW